MVGNCRSQRQEIGRNAMAKVLVVEDTEVNRLVLSSRLGSQGFEVVVAVDGEEGLDKAQQEEPDIILLDMYLPGMDGEQVIQALKQDVSTQNIPIIAITAHATSRRRDATIDLGCDEYEMKPVNFERLVEKISRLLKPSP
jgi:two-component system cell cycle response regulator DivK